MPDATQDPDATAGDAELTELRALARRVQPDTVAWETPPSDLWDRIAVAADVTTKPGDEPAGDGPGETDNVRPLDGARPSAPRRGSTADRPLGWKVWGVAAAAAVVIIVTVGLLLPSGSSDDSTVVAAVALDRLGDSGEGRAELVEHDGSLQLRLSTSGLDAGEGFLEVWVINTDVTQLVSLGPLRDDGIYELPAGLDPASFPIVDVSVEPIDGVPTHSGDSVLRGQLTF
ncbi:MAG TPA: anti-sigma factor [Gaiellaceae bacterium]|nr:anti-sigma factor [Gaiellaceae bacterium]